MKKFFKSLLTLLVAIAILVSGVVTVSADNNSSVITPRWNITESKNTTFRISSSGIATVNASYIADSSTFQKATVTVKIEKRFLLVFWNVVDIGYTNNQWVASSTNPNGVFSNTFTVNGKGMYRAHITLVITGNNGQQDVIEETLQYEYK